MTPGENVLKTGAHCTMTPDDRRHMGTTTDNQRRSTERARIGLVRIGQATCKDSRKQDSLKKGDDGYSKDELFIEKSKVSLLPEIKRVCKGPTQNQNMLTIFGNKI